MTGDPKPRVEAPHLRPVDGRGPEARTGKPGPVADDEDVTLPPRVVAARRHRQRIGPPGPGAFSIAVRLGLLFVLATAAAFLLAPRLVRGDLPDDAALVGTPARAFVKADRDYALVDTDTTSALRDAAAARSFSVWDPDASLAQKEGQVLQKGLLRLAVAFEPVRPATGTPKDVRVPAQAFTAAD